MPLVEFTSDFDWNVPRYGGRVTVAYKMGTRKLVTRDCAEEAVSKGKGRRTVNPRRHRSLKHQLEIATAKYEVQLSEAQARTFATLRDKDAEHGESTD